MFVAAQNAQAQSLLLQCGSAWNLFLMSGTAPESMQAMPFQLANMDSVYSNCLAALRVTAVNSAGYGQELLAFEHTGNLVMLKQHGARTLNGVAGIQCIPQAISSNIAGLDEPQGYVNGLEDNGVAATATTHIVTGGWIQFDLGTPCSISRVLFGNMSNTAFNASNAQLEYYDGNAWVSAGASVGVKTYSLTGVEMLAVPQTAQLWRIRFLDNTGTVVANTFRYRFVRFIANALPANVFDRSSTDFGWAVLVPAAPVTATYKSADATQLPAMIFTAGGPVDGKVCVLNRRRASINDSLAVVHLKVFGGVVQEIEDIV